ncbi:TfoX/Sxy family protein [Mixta tenebrionis]|uniref:TfoX/Sxy family protein n=1 Tax=Mixta tenebrionis TaxID=2562439 RepID=A0A506V995_9GAMM|nr:TfoX/Sxy family protein [Mixta tenebrionis]TPW42504.1 TfoX/Sxy family protein [Mixta tenebrionis]
MKASDELTDFILDQLAPLGRFAIRRMFNSTALFQDGLMVLLIDHAGVVFLKTDALNRDRFIAAGCSPFTYTRRSANGTLKAVALSFYTLPDGLLEDQEALLDWVRSAGEAARRASSNKRRARDSAFPTA